MEIGGAVPWQEVDTQAPWPGMVTRSLTTSTTAPSRTSGRVTETCHPPAQSSWRCTIMSRWGILHYLCLKSIWIKNFMFLSPANPCIIQTPLDSIISCVIFKSNIIHHSRYNKQELLPPISILRLVPLCVKWCYFQSQLSLQIEIIHILQSVWWKSLAHSMETLNPRHFIETDISGSPWWDSEEGPEEHEGCNGEAGKFRESEQFLWPGAGTGETPSPSPLAPPQL